MLGTPWIDRPVDTRGLRSLLPRSSSAAWKRAHAQANDRHSSRVFAMPPERLCPDDPKRLTRSRRRSAVGETRKLAAILVSDVVGYSRLAGADEDRIARLRTLRSDLIDPIISVHHGRIVKRTGDGSIIEFRSVVDAVRCAIEVQNGMIERNSVFRRSVASNFASASIWATWSRRAMAIDGRRRQYRLSARGHRQARRDLPFRTSLLAGQGTARDGRQAISARPNSRTSSSRSTSIHSRSASRRQAKPVVTVAAATSESAAAPPQAAPGFRNRPALAAALAVALLGAGAFAWRAGYAPRSMSASVHDKLANAPRLSIVVLPFENSSGDKDQDYFADGITEDLTTDLSHVFDFVIARNTAFTYKGKSVDAKQIGRELGVKYLLEGSVRRVGETITINAQLISTETGAHVWADRFEGERSKLGDLQVEAVSRLGNSLGAELVKAEALRAMRERPKTRTPSTSRCGERRS